MIVIATILCDRKSSSQLISIPSSAKIEGDTRLYVNIETSLHGEEFEEKYKELLNFLRTECPIPYDLDVWSINSSWMPKPAFDQDQARLNGITLARNMALNFAFNARASHILFIDADVIPAPDGLNKLLETGKPFVGGFVRGRGAHSGATYIFYPTGNTEMNGQLIECSHGTCGYMLISSDIFKYFRFRQGPDFKHPEIMLSEDPAFCNDVKYHKGVTFWIRKDVVGTHWDDPKNPFLGNNHSAQF